MDFPSERIEEQVELLPDAPGCYLFYDKDDAVIYVGKAVSLRKRVRSYFRPSRQLTRKGLLMVRHIDRVEHMVTDTEVEALILENNLIKEHHPRFNVRMRDDKNYPYLRLDLSEDFPRPEIVRERQDDDASYYGPFPNATALRDTLKTLRRVFPFRSCSDRRLDQPRACLYFHIGRCQAPCEGRVTPEDYHDNMEAMGRFLSGRQDDVLGELESEMQAASDDLRFEEAAELRDQMKSLRAVQEKQKIITGDFVDQDILGMHRDEEDAYVQVFLMRHGKIVGREGFGLNGTADSDDGEVMAAFIQQYYADAPVVPKHVLVPAEPEDRETIAAWLSERRGNRVYIKHPQRGEKRRLVEMVTENAQRSLEQERASRRRHRERTTGAVQALAEALELEAAPRRIECYDISNIQGSQTVGAMVTFMDGEPLKSQYRRFRIRDVDGPDDYAAMSEMIYRRFKRAGREDEDNEAFAAMPDLVIIDGGKGQLHAALEVLEYLEMDVPVYGLAKREEELFAPNRPQPITLPRGSAALQLLQRVRDEAHRFAVSYHRRLRRSSTIKSALEQVKGVGPRRRQALLQTFGSVERLRQASVDEIAEVKGISDTVAERVYTQVHRG